MKKSNLYTDIADELRRRIQEGHYQPGTRIPGHTRLAREFGVSPITSNRALQELFREGLLVRRERVGSFVSAQALQLRRIALLLPARAGEEGQGNHDYINGILERSVELGLETKIHYLLGSTLSSVEWMQQNASDGFINIGQAQYDTVLTARNLSRSLVVVGTDQPPGDGFATEDRRACTRDLVRAMIEDGYRRIGFIGNLFWPDHRTSRDGYMDAIQDLGLGMRLIRDATEQTVNAVVEDLIADDLQVDAVVAIGGNLSIAALPLVMLRRPQIKFGCLRENASVAQFADVCYYGEYFQEEVGRLAVDLLNDIHSGHAKNGAVYHASYQIHRPKISA